MLGYEEKLSEQLVHKFGRNFIGDENFKVELELDSIKDEHCFRDNLYELVLPQNVLQIEIIRCYDNSEISSGYTEILFSVKPILIPAKITKNGLKLANAVKLEKSMEISYLMNVEKGEYTSNIFMYLPENCDLFSQSIHPFAVYFEFSFKLKLL
jgi:hypothetical protein